MSALSGQRLVVALVRGVHGLRGDVRIEILTDHPELRYAPGAVLLREGSDEPLTVAWSSPIADGPGWRIRFDEVRARAEAEELKGVYLEAVVGPEAEPARGSYFWHEIVGTPVSGVDGTVLGTVHDVYRSGGAEVFVVAGGEFGEFDVPAVRDFVRVFAPRRGEIVIDAEALDLQRPRRRGEGEPRPKAPRRRTRRPKRTLTAEGPMDAAAADPTDAAAAGQTDAAAAGPTAAAAEGDRGAPAILIDAVAPEPETSAPEKGPSPSDPARAKA